VGDRLELAELRRPSARRSCSAERTLYLELSAIGLSLRRALIGHERTIAVTAVRGGCAFLRKFWRVGNGN